MVPFLVLLPLVERTDLTSTGAMDLLSQLGPTALETLGSLGLLLLGGRIILRRVFEVCSTGQPPCPSCSCVSYGRHVRQLPKVHSAEQTVWCCL